MGLPTPHVRTIAGSPQAAPATPSGVTERRIAAEDLAPVKARILLMLALTRTTEGSEIQRMFTEY